MAGWPVYQLLRGRAALHAPLQPAGLPGVQRGACQHIASGASTLLRRIKAGPHLLGRGDRHLRLDLRGAAGLVGLARSVARELGPRGITANVVAPGLVTSDMTAVLSAERQQAILARTASGRATESDEIARSVVYLASEAAATVNGSVLTIDGGLSAGV